MSASEMVFLQPLQPLLFPLLRCCAMEIVKVYDRSTRAREPQDCNGVSPTLLSFAGTGGCNDPFVVIVSNFEEGCDVGKTAISGV